MIRVLLADDVPAYRTLLHIVLDADPRFTVVGEAGDGAQAVQLAESEAPDLVLLDLAMPVMDGMQALTAIKKRSPQTLVIVLSGFPEAQLAREATALGADGYVEKGTPPPALLDAIAAIAGRSAAAPL